MTPVPARGRRHPISLAAEARRLHAGGWTPAEIVGLFARRDITVSISTVRRWTNPHIAAKARQQDLQASRARASRRSGRLTVTRPTPEFIHVRITALRQLGLTYPAIAAVISFDFNTELTVDQVRYALKYRTHSARNGLPPRTQTPQAE